MARHHFDASVSGDTCDLASEIWRLVFTPVQSARMAPHGQIYLVRFSTPQHTGVLSLPLDHTTAHAGELTNLPEASGELHHAKAV